MFIFVLLYLYLYIEFIFVHLYRYLYICIDICTFVLIFVHIYWYLYIYIHISTLILIFVHLYLYNGASKTFQEIYVAQTSACRHRWSFNEKSRTEDPFSVIEPRRHSATDKGLLSAGEGSPGSLAIVITAARHHLHGVTPREALLTLCRCPFLTLLLPAFLCWSSSSPFFLFSFSHVKNT